MIPYRTKLFYDKDKEKWKDSKTGEPVCPKKGPSKAAVYKDYLYVNCLKETFKTVERDIIDHGSARQSTPDETFL